MYHEEHAAFAAVAHHNHQIKRLGYWKVCRMVVARGGSRVQRPKDQTRPGETGQGQADFTPDW